ncbi:acylphosphatase [Sphingomonas sp. RS2018]
MQRILVSGRVQQVGYRDYMVRKAQALGVRGWVRNLTDGRVEMLADGDDAAIEAFLAATREGPAMARVDDVVTVPTDDRAVKGFTKRFTA